MGLLQAHVIRLIPPCDPAVVSKRHYHDVHVQMIYVLKGWIRSEFEGQGEVTMRAGTAWLQPPRIKHTVLDYSDDCELLEIILPAEFETVELLIADRRHFSLPRQAGVIKSNNVGGIHDQERKVSGKGDHAAPGA